MTNHQYLEINSKDNAKIKHLRALCEQASQRRKSQQTVLEGIHLIDAWLKTSQPIVAIYLTPSALQHPEVQALAPLLACPIYIIAEALYQDIRTLGPGIDMMAMVEVIEPSSTLDPSADMLILENLQDPGNVGTLLRTAAAAGIRQIVCSTGTASIWSPRVLRAGMGAQFSLKIYERINLEELIPTLSLPLYVTSSHAEKSLYALNLTSACAWLMGNEGQGASDFSQQHAITVGIPQPGGQESLNVAVAGAICLFEMVRQRIT
jgi:TrmH family RNA methyltransferase